MRSGQQGAAVRHLRALLGEGATGHLSDGQLIERFLARSGAEGESAFAALVERHGPAVLRVCRSVLVDAESAQDAFQATFLVLVRKAGSVRVRDSLGPWLVAVAYRTASSARSAEARRRAVERDAAVAEARTSPESREDLGAVRDEVDRLEDRYRRPILLCYFAGLTHEGAARQLGCPVGTVRSRLAWGRKQLRDRLVRRGLAPSAASASLAAAPTRAGVPTTLLIQTARAASRLAAGEAATATGAVSAAAVAQAEGIVRAMFMSKLKGIAAAVLALGIAATGGVVLAQQGEAGSAPAEKKASPGPTPDRRGQAGQDEPRRLLGLRTEPPAAPKVRPDVEIEMLLSAAREQEQAGHPDQALALTGRMEVALRAWRAELERRQASTAGETGKKKLTLDLFGPPTLAAERRRLGLEDAERAAVPFPDTEVIEFPTGEKWAGLLERRVRREPSAKLSAPAIRARLEEKVSIHLVQPFSLGEALQVIRGASAGKEDTGIPIYVDLKQVKLTLDSPVTLDVEGAPLSQALAGLLDPLGLSYHVKDGWILIDAAKPASPMRR